MNRFTNLNEKELSLIKEAGYEVEQNKEYSIEDYNKCESIIGEYIMSHSKNDIPNIENKFRGILGKIV